MGLKLTKEQWEIGEWYYEFEEETGAYHIYHTESDHSPYSYSSEEESERKINELNRKEDELNLKTRTLGQIEYDMDQLKKEKEVLIENMIDNKIDEFVKLFTEMPPTDEKDLKRVLKMFARDIKNINEL